MIDLEVRAKEIAKLKKMNYSRNMLTASLSGGNHKSICNDARVLDINLDWILQTISPGKTPAMAQVMEDLNIAMVDTASRGSSKVEDLKGHGTLEDECASAYLQRLYTIGSRFTRHPLIAAFTLTPIADGTVFNPYSHTPVREKEEIEPEADYTMYLAESWNTVDDTERIPLYEDKAIDRTKRRVTELSQIEVMKFAFTEDAKAIYKYGTGIQWSFESSFREVRMQLLGTWVMREAITDRIWLLMDLFGTAIDFAHAKGRTYTIPAGDSAGKWTYDKIEDYNNRWRIPYLYDCMISEPTAKTKFKQADFGSDNWTIGHLMMFSNFFSLNYEDVRMNRKVSMLDLPGLTGEDGESNAFGDSDYLFMKKSAAVGQVYNTGMTRDAMDTDEGIQGFIRYFTMGTRFYGIRPKAVEIATLA